jgi:hypothetical protein
MVVFFEGVNADLKRRPARQVLFTRENVSGSYGAIERVDRDGSTRRRGR